MTLLRALIRDHRGLAMLVLALTLCVKALVPQGYMVGNGQKLLTVQLCLDGIRHQTVQIALPSDGSTGQTDSHSTGKSSEHCAFTALNMGALGGADAPLLALALLFILALGFAPVQAPQPRRTSYLRPPLRGPPIVFLTI